MPQQIGQMSPLTAGQYRLARRLPHISQRAVTTPIINRTVNSEVMQRIDVYIKVEVELEDEEKLERVTNEICRQVEKMYIVRKAELSSVISRD